MTKQSWCGTRGNIGSTRAMETLWMPPLGMRGLGADRFPLMGADGIDGMHPVALCDTMSDGG